MIAARVLTTAVWIGVGVCVGVTMRLDFAPALLTLWVVVATALGVVLGGTLLGVVVRGMLRGDLPVEGLCHADAPDRNAADGGSPAGRD